MTLINRIRRLTQIPPSYVLGRFCIVRKCYALVRSVRQRLLGNGRPQTAESAYFKGLDVAKSATDVRRDAFTMLPPLPPEVVAEIRDFAMRERLKGQGDVGEFYYRDVAGGRLHDGRPVALAHVQDCTACPSVARLRDDVILDAVVCRYLGYTPPRKDVNLYWSFVAALTEQQRREQNQTIDFHFDVHDYNFCYLHVYISDTDAASGAHVLVRGSHGRKPWRWLIGSARRSDAEIRSYYSEAQVLTIEGPGGTGFLEDTACFHKALPPTDRERLLLQIRYH